MNRFNNVNLVKRIKTRTTPHTELSYELYWCLVYRKRGMSECGWMCVIIKFQLQPAISIKRIPINLIMSPASIIVLIDLLSLQLSTYCHVVVCWLWNIVCAQYTLGRTQAQAHTHIAPKRRTIGSNFMKVTQLKWLNHPIAHVVAKFVLCDDSAHLLLFALIHSHHLCLLSFFSVFFYHYY